MVVWKKFVLMAAGFGGGFAVVMGAIVGSWVWYQARPQKEREWNTTAIKATFKDVVITTIDAKAEIHLFIQLGKYDRLRLFHRRQVAGPRNGDATGRKRS
jgi:hypothetical protein